MKVHVSVSVVRAHSRNSNLTRMLAASIFSQYSSRAAAFLQFLANMQYPQQHQFLPTHLKLATTSSSPQSQFYQGCGPYRTSQREEKLDCCIPGLKGEWRKSLTPKPANDSSHQASNFIREITSEQGMLHTHVLQLESLELMHLFMIQKSENSSALEGWC